MSVYLKELTSALVEEPDVRVDIFTRSQDPACSKVKDVSPRIRVIQVKGGPEKPVDRRTLYRYVPEFSARMEEHLLRESVEYDLIHSHYWLSGLSGLRIHRKRGWPLVHTYHTLDFMKKKAGDGQDHSKRPVSERLLAEYSDLIISPTDAEKQSLVAEYDLSPERVAVVYPGVNRRLFYRTPGSAVLRDPDSEQEACVFLYVGRIEPVKGLMDVVLAFDLMRQEAPSLFQKARLAVIGGGSREELRSNPEFLRIQKTVKENGLSERVEFLGSIPQAQLRRYYSSADALVVPSLYESFGLVVIEALACGTPVIVSRIGEMATIV
ncbi:MAG: glycosyltransferase, partial [Candidatus Aminicenantales bacterium]